MDETRSFLSECFALPGVCRQRLAYRQAYRLYPNHRQNRNICRFGEILALNRVKGSTPPPTQRTTKP